MRLNAGAAPRFQADGTALSFVGRIALAKNFGEVALYRLSNLFFFLAIQTATNPGPTCHRIQEVATAAQSWRRPRSRSRLRRLPRSVQLLVGLTRRGGEDEYGRDSDRPSRLDALILIVGKSGKQILVIGDELDKNFCPLFVGRLALQALPQLLILRGIRLDLLDALQHARVSYFLVQLFRYINLLEGNHVRHAEFLSQQATILQQRSNCTCDRLRVNREQSVTSIAQSTVPQRRTEKSGPPQSGRAR